MSLGSVALRGRKEGARGGMKKEREEIKVYGHYSLASVFRLDAGRETKSKADIIDNVNVCLEKVTFFADHRVIPLLCYCLSENAGVLMYAYICV